MGKGKVRTFRPRTGKYVHVRVRSPKQFKPKSFRTHDIGRAGHSKRVAGKLKSGKGKGKWATQKYLIPKSDIEKPSGQKLMKQIKARHG